MRKPQVEPPMKDRATSLFVSSSGAGSLSQASRPASGLLTLALRASVPSPQFHSPVDCIPCLSRVRFDALDFLGFLALLFATVK